MTKNTTRKTAAKKAAAKTPEPKAPEPMDTAPIPGNTSATQITQRPSYAGAALVAEVDEMFEGVPHEFSAPNQFRVMLDVSFDLSVLDSDDAKMLSRLLVLAEDDPRVREVLVSDGQAVVSILAHPVRQDSRAPFGLSQARDILMGHDQ